MVMKYIDREGLAYYNQKLLEIIKTKANTSDVDETTARIDEAIAASNAAIAETVSALNALRSNTESSISDLQNKDLEIGNRITTLSTVKADKTVVTQEIDDAIKSVTQFNYEIVDELPTTGVKGVIYLMLYDSGPHGNIYQEWIWLPTKDKYETLGSTNQVNLDNYITFDDLTKITNIEIENMFA